MRAHERAKPCNQPLVAAARWIHWRRFHRSAFIDTGFTDATNQRVGDYESWPTLAMTLINAANAVSRKVIRASSIAFPEMQWYRIAESSFSNFMAGRQLPFR